MIYCIACVAALTLALAVWCALLTRRLKSLESRHDCTVDLMKAMPGYTEAMRAVVFEPMLASMRKLEEGFERLGLDSEPIRDGREEVERAIEREVSR